MSASLAGEARSPSTTPPELEGQGSIKLEGWGLKVSQFHGLLIKRFHCAKRNTKGLFSQILLPAFFVCVAMTVALSVPEIGEPTPPHTPSCLRVGGLLSFCSFLHGDTEGSHFKG